MADIILFDSAPVLAVADAAILAPKVDGVILVVNAGSTRPEALAESANMLARGNARVLGVVLNQVARERSSYHYYYGQREQHGDGGKRSSGKKGFSGFPGRLGGK